MLGAKDDRNHAAAPLRLPAALLATAALAVVGAAPADAAMSHGSGGSSFTSSAAGTGTSTEPTVTFPTATTPSSAPQAVTPTGTLRGSVVAIDADSFTIQTRGPMTGVIDAMTSYASELAAKDYPYVWGGGHEIAQVASVGSPGPGANGKRKGFDCSGTVAAVLAAGGLWPKGQGVPNDAGVIQDLLKGGLIAKGPGTGPDEVTLYDDPGVHIFMNIDGRFFGTSDGAGGGGDAAGGPGWLSDGAPDALNARVYRRYHVLPGALADRGSYGHQITFQYAGGIPGGEEAAGLSLDANVRVDYAQAGDGALNMATVSYSGSSTVTGTVETVDATGSQFTLTTAGGRMLTLYVPDSTLTSGLLPGESVTVTYTRQGATTSTPAELVIHSLTDNGQTTTPTAPTNTTTTPAKTTTTPTSTPTTPTTTTVTTPATGTVTTTPPAGGAATGTTPATSTVPITSTVTAPAGTATIASGGVSTNLPPAASGGGRL